MSDKDSIKVARRKINFRNRNIKEKTKRILELEEQNKIMREALEYVAAYNKHLYDLYDESAELLRCQQKARDALEKCNPMKTASEEKK